MGSSRLGALVAVVGALGGVLLASTDAVGSTPMVEASEVCSSGAHTLSAPGSRVYPEMGNGGYTSEHTDLHLNYDAIANLFLPGTHADLTVVATQCLTDLSFDFERTNGLTAGGSGPDMIVGSVMVNGQPAASAFVQPTYPGDPNGQDDPDPAAHAVSNVNPVGGGNANPPACSPQVGDNTQNGTQCPANKLVVTPAAPIPTGMTFTVTINYTGRPGLHPDGDGSSEGWFRVSTPGGEGSFVTTEPVGNASWMPLNNFPTAKPTYDIFDTTNIGKVAIGPGELVGYTAPEGTSYVPVPAPSSNAADANFPGGSVTWHWHSPERIASYLVENSIGSYLLTARTSPTSGVQYWQAQDASISGARQVTNKIAMDNHEDITDFQTIFNGPWPMTTNGVIVGTPPASFEEEMQGKITFAGGQIGGTVGTSLGTFNHENMHQWFGDNVSESSFNMTFWKEGFATLSEYLTTARGTPPGVTEGPAFEASLVGRFNNTSNYNTSSGSFWTSAPSNPSVGNLFSTASTYTRPGTANIALWHILTRDGMIAAMHEIQSTYAQSSITEAQLEDVFRSHLPVQSASCNARLTSFFTQWWDTAYPSGGGLNKPQLTGPGLNGPGFPCAQVTPAAPDGDNGWYTSPVTVAWSGFPTVQATQTATKNECVDETVSTDGVYSKPCGVTVTTTATSAVVADSGLVSETFQIDATKPTISIATPSEGATYAVGAAVAADYSCADETSGIASCVGDVADGASIDTSTIGLHTFTVVATDVAGNVLTTQHSYSVAPIADAGGPYAVAEGEGLTLDGSGSTPGATYGWDLDGDNDFSDATGPAPVLTWGDLEQFGIDDGPATYEIGLQVTFNGVSSIAAADVDATNTAPGVVLTGPLTPTADVPYTIKVGADDPSSADMAGTFHYTVDWGDGSAIESVDGPSDPPVTHTYAQSGTFTPTFTATDKDGAGGTRSDVPLQVASAVATTTTTTTTTTATTTTTTAVPTTTAATPATDAPTTSTAPTAAVATTTMALTTDLPETGGRPRDILVIVALLLAVGLGMVAAARRRATS